MAGHVHGAGDPHGLRTLSSTSHNADRTAGQLATGTQSRSREHRAGHGNTEHVADSRVYTQQVKSTQSRSLEKLVLHSAGDTLRQEAASEMHAGCVAMP